MVFPVVIYSCECWTIKKVDTRKWCFWTVCWSRLFESPLDSKGIKPIKPKGNQPGICIGRTCAEAEAPVLWPLDAKSPFIGKGPDAGKDWRQKEKGMTEDEMVRLHHQLNGHEFEQAPGDSVGQRSPACCSPWSCKESDTTWRLNDSFQVVCWCQSVFPVTLAVSVSPWALRIKNKTKQNSVLLSYRSSKHIDPSLLDEFFCCKQLCDHHPGQAPGHFQHPDDSFGLLPLGACHGSSLFWPIVGFYLIKDSQPVLTRAWLLCTAVSVSDDRAYIFGPFLLPRPSPLWSHHHSCFLSVARGQRDSSVGLRWVRLSCMHAYVFISLG